MKANLQYLKYVLRHKWFVFQACMDVAPWRLLWRAFIHDWHKFLPSEWGPYVDYFYRDYPSCENVGVFHKTYFGDKHTKEWAQKRFDIAWLHHQHLADHHWQHWILHEDDGTTKLMPMPSIVILEMICDWIGAGQAINGKNDVVSWYTKNKDNMLLHPETREHVEILLKLRKPATSWHIYPEWTKQS